MNAFDQVVKSLSDALAGCDRRWQVAFFTVAGRVLGPTYVSFVEASGFGDTTAVEQALSCAEAYAIEGVADVPEGLSERLEAAAPHEDNFDAPASTYAQDVVICAETALGLSRGMTIDLDNVQFVLEPMQASLLDSSQDAPPTENEWLDQVMEVSAMQGAVAACRSILTELTSAEQVDATLLNRLRDISLVLLPPGSR